MLPTLLGVALVTFVLIRVIPGDVVELRYSGDRGAVSQDLLDKERARIGLDKPLWQQFATWMWGVVRLDFGTSMWTGAPILEEIKLRFALAAGGDHGHHRGRHPGHSARRAGRAQAGHLG